MKLLFFLTTYLFAFTLMKRGSTPAEINSLKNIFTMKHDVWVDGHDHDLDMDEYFF